MYQHPVKALGSRIKSLHSDILQQVEGCSHKAVVIGSSPIIRTVWIAYLVKVLHCEWRDRVRVPATPFKINIMVNIDKDTLNKWINIDKLSYIEIGMYPLSLIHYWKGNRLHEGSIPSIPTIRQWVQILPSVLFLQLSEWLRSQSAKLWYGSSSLPLESY